MPTTGRLFIFMLFLFLAPLSADTRAAADDGQDGILVGRIAHVEGKLLRYVAEDEDWVATVQDAPFGLEDALYAGDGTRAECILPNKTWIRIGGNTQIQMISLDPEATTVDVASGLVRMYNNNRDVVIKATTPFGYVVAPEGAVFDLYVGDDSLEVIPVRGSVDFVHGATGTRYEVREGEASLIADGRDTARGNSTVDAAWDDWNGQRDSLWATRLRAHRQGAEYLPAPLQDEAYALEENGRWERVYYEGDYRSMWLPTTVDPGWRPFTAGRWTVYYGDNCWIPAEPFGYVTHHYGSWVWVDSFRRWYWLPPVARVVRDTPGFSLGFNWYPGRVGWIHSGPSVGWIPLAPDEDYYCHRPWGRRVVVVNQAAVVNLNINRYRYLDRAVVISRDHLYRGSRYTPYVQRIGRGDLVSKYKPVTVIDNTVIRTYDTDRRRFAFNDAKVERKPHAAVLGRINDNQRFIRNAGRIDRQQIRQDLDRIPMGTRPTATAARTPVVSSKLVDANKMTRPSEAVSFGTREMKPKERQRQLMFGTEQAAGSRGGGEGIQARPAGGSDEFRRMRAAKDARDRMMQRTEAAVPSPAASQPFSNRQPTLKDREAMAPASRGPTAQGSEQRTRSPLEMQPGQRPGPFSRQPDQPRAQEVIRQRQEDQQRAQQQEMQRRQQEASQQWQQQDFRQRREDQQRTQQQEMQRRQQEASQQRQQQDFRQRREDQQRTQQQEMQRRQQEASQQRQQQEMQRRQQEASQQRQDFRQRQEGQQQQQQGRKWRKPQEEQAQGVPGQRQ